MLTSRAVLVLAILLVAALAAAEPRAWAGTAVTATAVTAPAQPHAVVVAERRAHGVRFVRYRQILGGLPVLGSDTVLTDAPGWHGDLRIGKARRIGTVPKAGTVTAARAVATARRYTAVEELRAPARATLAILPLHERAVTVWRVRLPARRPLASFEVLVDARTGSVVRTRDVLWHAFTATGQGNVFDTNPVVAQGSRNGLADNGDADSPALTSLLSERPLPRLDTDALPGCLEGRWVHATVPSGEVCRADRDFSDLTRSDDDFEAVMSYFHADRAQDYIQSLGFANVLNRQIRVHANELFDGEEEDNSFYDPSTGEISLGTGGTDDGEDGEVVAHEYGHAVQDDQVPNFGLSDEGGAMGEGFGDYLAAALARVFAPNSVFDPCVAEWDELGFGSFDQIPCLRRVDTDVTAAQVGPGTPCDGEVHCAGQAWSGALWDIRAQVGAATADRLVIQSHFSLTPSSDFHEGALALIAADRSLYAGVHETFVRNLLVTRGLLDLDRLDDTPSGARQLGIGSGASGTLSASGDAHDLYALSLTAGQPIVIRLASSAEEYDLRLLRPGSTSASDPSAVVAAAETLGSNEILAFRPSQTGVHFLDVAAIAGSGAYSVVALLDSDGDLRADSEDNCPAVANSAQPDRDADGLGDPCDRFPEDAANDHDGDGIGRVEDNCPAVANRRQRDWDFDGRGDVCDRSARIRVAISRRGRQTLALRVTVRPVTIGRRAIRVDARRSSCVRACRFDTLGKGVRVRRSGRGRFAIAVRLGGGVDRIRVRLADRRHERVASRPLRVRAD